MTTVRDLLAERPGGVYTVGPKATVFEATQLMNEHKIGALVVTEDDEVAGMFTERDVLRRVVGEQRDPKTTHVRTVMTDKVVCCDIDATLNEVRALMKQRRIRHVPVIDPSGALLGMLSIGDLNAAALHNGQVTIEYMTEYIYGRG